MSGTFRNNGSKTEDFYPIRGRYTMVDSDVTFGFVNSWNNKATGNWKLTSSWAGIYKATLPEEITMFWISATDTNAPDLWDGFGVGKYVFKKMKM